MAKQLNLLHSNFIAETISQQRNAFGENMLHYACTLNYYEEIKKLIELDCKMLFEQDFRGRTPLHIAIEENVCQCMDEFRDILQGYQRQPTSVRLALRNMLQAYSHRGHTVVHAAVKADLPELLKDLIECSKLMKHNVLDYEILGNGDSLLHLAINCNLYNVAKVIKENIPSALNYPNYAGTMPLEMLNISEDILKMLSS